MGPKVYLMVCYGYPLDPSGLPFGPLCFPLLKMARDKWFEIKHWPLMLYIIKIIFVVWPWTYVLVCYGCLLYPLEPFGALWTPLVPLLDPTPLLRMARDKWLAFAFTNWPLMVHFYRTKAPSNGLLRILLRPLWSPFWTPLCFPLLKMARDKWFAIKNCLAVRCFCLLHTES